MKRTFTLLLLGGACWSASAAAQAPVDPSKKNVPAEIVPPKPASTPAPGKKTIDTTTPEAPLSPGSKAATEPAPATEQRVIEALTEPELDQVISLIRQRYISPGALSDTTVKRATVQGLMDRLGASAMLLAPGAAKAASESPFRSEILNERVGYLRLGAFTKENLAELDKALTAFGEKGVTALIIDLRATPASGDFERAAEVCRRFCPKGKVLFTLKRPEGKQQAEIFTTKEEPRLKALMTVLTNSHTEGSPEIVAGTLRALANAVVIGQKTKGAAAEFNEFPLQDGRTLRLAVAEVLLPGDVSVVPEGLTPDVPVDVPADQEAGLLAQELEKGVAPFVIETERVRMNEAALVAGTNPELDALQAAQGNRGAKPKPPQRDAILQRALDLITSLAIFEKGKVRPR